MCVLNHDFCCFETLLSDMLTMKTDAHVPQQEISKKNLKSDPDPEQFIPDSKDYKYGQCNTYISKAKYLHH
jgi:hypothetical protein